MPKQIVESPDVFPLRKYKSLDPPNGIPINMAVKASGAFLWTKQVPVNPQGVSVGEGDALAQTEQILRNLTAMTKAAGATMAGQAAGPPRCTVEHNGVVIHENFEVKGGGGLMLQHHTENGLAFRNIWVAPVKPGGQPASRTTAP